RGFVLVGVVMLILALTILGLSLFALSSYEAQFFNRSLYEHEALQAAVGGLERAKYVLAVPPITNLENVQTNLPLEYVTNALAVQEQHGDSLSSGPVDWSASANPVRISVTAVYKGVSRTVEGTFLPRKSPNWYKRL